MAGMTAVTSVPVFGFWFLVPAIRCMLESLTKPWWVSRRASGFCPLPDSCVVFRLSSFGAVWRSSFRTSSISPSSLSSSSKSSSDWAMHSQHTSRASIPCHCCISPCFRCWLHYLGAWHLQPSLEDVTVVTTAWSLRALSRLDVSFPPALAVMRCCATGNDTDVCVNLHTNSLALCCTMHVGGRKHPLALRNRAVTAMEALPGLAGGVDAYGAECCKMACPLLRPHPICTTHCFRSHARTRLFTGKCCLIAASLFRVFVYPLRHQHDTTHKPHPEFLTTSLAFYCISQCERCVPPFTAALHASLGGIHLWAANCLGNPASG